MTDVIKQLLLQIVLIMLNAFFASTEIAVISLNEKKIRAQAEDGDKKASKMLKMIEEPTKFLSTIQIGITLAGFLGSAFAADNFAELLSSWFVKAFSLSEASIGTVNTVSVILITLVLSFFTLVFGELVPKRIAMRHKEKLAKTVCGVITALSKVLSPVIWLLAASTNGVLKIFGIDKDNGEEPVSEEDIMLMLDAGEDDGSLDSNDIKYIKNVFKLDGMCADDIMMPRKNIVYVSEDDSDEKVISVIKSEGYSRIPVIAKDSASVVGILYARDFLLKDGGETVKDIMRPPVFVPETVHLDVLFKEMQTEHNHMVIVVNEYGETAGLVTMEDIIEEILGEIWDEGDEEVKNIVKTGENIYRIMSGTPTEEFFEFFSLEDEETDAVTVNGWITEKAGDIPEKGYKMQYENLEITVTDGNEIMTKELSVKVT